MSKRNLCFEVGITPKKLKKAPEVPVLILAPFTPVLKVEFTDVKLYTTCMRKVRIRNPTEKEIKIELQTLAAIGNNFTFSSSDFCIPGNGEDYVRIGWSPVELGNWRLNIAVKNLSGNKKFTYIVLLASSIPEKRAALKKIGNSLKGSKLKATQKKKTNRNSRSPKSTNNSRNEESGEQAFVQGVIPPYSLPPTLAHRGTYTINRTQALPSIDVGSDEEEDFKGFNCDENNEEEALSRTCYCSNLNQSLYFEETFEFESLSLCGMLYNVTEGRILNNLNNTQNKLRRQVYSSRKGDEEDNDFYITPLCIEFQNVKRYRRVERQVIIRNISRKEISVEITPPPLMLMDDYEFSSRYLKLPCNGERVLQIAWFPKVVGSWTYVIPVKAKKGSNQVDRIVVKANCVEPAYGYYQPIEFPRKPPNTLKIDLPRDEDISMGPYLSCGKEIKKRVITEIIANETFCVPSYSSFDSGNKGELNDEFSELREDSKSNENSSVSNTSDTALQPVVSPLGQCKRTFSEMSLNFDSESSKRNSSLMSLRLSASFNIRDSLESPNIIVNLEVSSELKTKDDEKDCTNVSENVIPLQSIVNLEKALSPIKKSEEELTCPESQGKFATSSRRNSVSSPMKINDSHLIFQEIYDTKTDNHENDMLCFEISPPKRTVNGSKPLGATVEKKSSLKRKAPKELQGKICRKSLRFSQSSDRQLNRIEDNIDENPVKCHEAAASCTYNKILNNDLGILRRNDFLEQYLNLDPFGPAALEDPFAKHLQYSYEWLEKQENQLIKWLNTLLTPPPELESVISGVDVAKLWEAAISSKTVQPAPNRDTVSTKYHSNPERMNALRKAASSLIHSEEFVQILGKLNGRVSKGIFSIKDDIDMYKDQGARRRLVELILSYNPLWLRIGLEAIFGRVIPLQTNKDIKGLIQFLNKNLLSNDKILAKHSYSKVVSLKMPTCKGEMNSFVVFKFLTLVFVLDQFKTRRMIPYDPCLFRKDSDFKESSAILNEFTKQFLKCISQMNKTLKSVGYVLTHKQTYLDEFDFAVKTRQDLRDGVRLVRTMEMILRNPTLCSKLRSPAISKLQKVHNVSIALIALESANFEIVGDITAKDIVEGHREKTMSLLWQILHRFLVPRYEASAKKIQIWWRQNSLKVAIRKRISMKKEKKSTNAATKIQGYWRGYCTRKWFAKEKLIMKERKERILRSAVIIQKSYRRYMARKYFKKMKESVRKIEAFYSKQKKWKLLIEESKHERNQFILLRKSAIKIQIWFRALIKQKIERENYLVIRFRAAVKIQSWFKMITQKRIYLNHRKLISVIQKCYRHKLEKRNTQLLSINERNKFLQIRLSTLLIQRNFKMYRQMKVHRTIFLELRRATTFVQNRWRFIKVLKEKNNAATLIQRSFKTYITRKRYLNLKASASLIQKFYRIMKEKERLRETSDMQRGLFLKIHRSVLIIQRSFKAQKKMKLERIYFLGLKRMVIFLQYRWRFKKQFKERRNAASVIQRAFKTYMTRKESATQIQKWYRHILEKRKCISMAENQRIWFLERKLSAINIQQMFRGYLLMKKEKQSYLSLRNTTVFVQNRWRFKKTMMLKHNSAVVIQQAFRMFITRKKFLRLRDCTCIIQRIYRLKIERKKSSILSQHLREIFLKKRNSAVLLQSFYRAHRIKKVIRSQFVNLRRAAIFVQTRWRYKQIMLKRVNSALILQKFYRGYAAKKKYHSVRSGIIGFQKLFRLYTVKKLIFQRQRLILSAVYIIQNRFLAYKAMKNDREDYLKLRRCAIFVQDRWRFIRHLSEKKASAAVLIQKTFRAYKTRKQYLELKNASSVIQRWYRNKLQKRELLPLMENVRHNFNIIKNAAVIIQRSFRLYKGAKEERYHFLSLKRSAVFFQLRWRYILLTRKRKRAACMVLKALEFYAAFRERAAIRIQNWYRNVKQNKPRVGLMGIVQVKEGSRNNFEDAWRKPITDESRNSLAFVYYSACRQLKCIKNLSDLEILFSNFDTVSFLSAELCEKLSTFSPFHYTLWDTLDKQTRSQEYQIIFSFGLSIILNMAAFHKAIDNMWKNMLKYNGIEITFILMSKFVVSNKEIFCKCCTLLWLLARHPRYAKTLRQFSLCKERIMRFYTRLKAKPLQERIKGITLPCTELQFGNYKKQTKYFTNQIHGLDCLYTSLNLKMIK